MAHFKIEGIPGLDGDYPFEFRFTNRDFRTIKRLAGVRSNEVMEAFRAGDNDLVVAFCVIALERSGKPFHEDQIWDADVGAVDFVLDDEEAKTSPPAPVSSSVSEDSQPTSGEPSRPTSEPSPETTETEKSSGFLRSVTGADSGQETSPT